MIPAMETLKQYPHWVAWRRERKQRHDGTWKDVKMPKNPYTGGNACSDKPVTWGTFEQAKMAYKQIGAAGVGCFFTLEMGMVYIDLDDCVDEQGIINEQAQAIIADINSYTEFSPSGRGIHIVAYGQLPRALKGDAVGVEMYQERKYLTATGRYLDGLPMTIEPAQEAITAVYQRYAPKREERPARPYTGNDAPNYETVRDALQCIPPVIGYHDWVSICMAIHSAFPDDSGVALIEDWSPGYEGEVEEKFRSFRGGKTTLGTLYYHAKQHGWSRTESAARSTVGRVSMVMPEL